MLPLTSFTLSIVNRETICKDLKGGNRADSALYHYTDAQTGKPILPIKNLEGFEDGPIIIDGNNLAMQSQLSQVDCHHQVKILADDDSPWLEEGS